VFQPSRRCRGRAIAQTIASGTTAAVLAAVGAAHDGTVSANDTIMLPALRPLAQSTRREIIAASYFNVL
jgi:hypothetical protein